MANELVKSKLRQIAEIFSKHRVDFIVIGGVAEALMGSPRITYDLDLCYRRDKQNLENLANALKELSVRLRGVPEDVPFVIDARSLALGSNFTFVASLGELDLLGWVEPLGDFDRLIQTAESFEIGDLVVRGIALDDLITVKRHVNRPKDRESLFQLLAIKRIREEKK